MTLAANPHVAWRLACERLAVGWEEFSRMSPVELAWRLWGERRRRNYRARMLAWLGSLLVSPHVEKRHRSQVSVRRLYMAASGGDLDPDEMGD